MAWIEQTSRRGLMDKTWLNDETGQYRFVQVSGTHLHYPTASPDSDILDGMVDFSPVRVNNAQLDGWMINSGGWRYALGIPAEYPGQDGWVGFGGRQGQNWLKTRLLRCGYLHGPTRTWQDVGGAPTYNRGDLSSEISPVTIGPEGVEEIINALSVTTWHNIWNTPGDGEVFIEWVKEGKKLREDITINQAAREWIVANRPPSTNPSETFFGFVFRLDVSDIPKWIKNGIAQNIEGDFDDEGGGFELQDSLNRFLVSMPMSHARSGDGVVNLRKRIWKDGDGNHYLLVGVRVPDLNGLPAGDITFDPDYAIDATAGDTTLLSGNQDRATGSDATLAYNTAANAVSLMKFDVSAIPSGATCNSADLFLYQYGAAPVGARTFYIHEVLAANDGWLAGSTEDPATSTQSTWDYKNHSTSTSWAGAEGCQTSGTDFDAAELGSVSGGGSDGVEIEISLTAGSVEDWWAPTNENYGIISWASDWISVDSNDSVTAAERPKLTIDYSVAGGATPTGNPLQIRSPLGGPI